MEVVDLLVTRNRPNSLSAQASGTSRWFAQSARPRLGLRPSRGPFPLRRSALAPRKLSGTPSSPEDFPPGNSSTGIHSKVPAWRFGAGARVGVTVGGRGLAGDKDRLPTKIVKRLPGENQNT